MKGKNIILLLFLMTSINFTSAIGDIGTVKQFDCISLYNYCPTCTYINYTAIKYPNSTIVDLNLGMTKSNYNYNYTFCDTSSIGEHFYTTCGDKGGTTPACEDISFEVTPSGFTLSTGFYVLIMILSVGLVVLGFYIQDNWVIVLGGFGMIFIGLFLLFNGINNFRDNVYTWGLGIIFLMTGSYFSIRGSYEALS
jgi:hypothetical protein